MDLTSIKDGLVTASKYTSQYDFNTEQYSLSLFTLGQPKLNWKPPKVRAAVLDVMHFWLQRVRLGYRMDVIEFVKEQRFPDATRTKFSLPPWA